VDEDVLPTIVADDEAEALLRIEEFDDALAFANDLRGHPATAAAAETAAATAAAETAAAARAAAVAATATAAEAAAITKSAASGTAATVAALLKTKFPVLLLAAEEIVAFVAPTTAAVALAPFIETHEPSELRSPPTPQTNALGPNGATGHGA
jgi:hypothetical protein